jgi:transposase
MNKHMAIGIDLAKRSFQVCPVDTRNLKVRSNKAVKRGELLDYMRQQPPCRVFMEACGGAHYWARQFRAVGHEVKLIAPQFVTPFRKGHKTDANDALAIAEAGLRPQMRFVPLKGLEQQDLQCMHRIRERLIKQRTQLINQAHGLLQEYGVVSGRGQKALKNTIRELQDAPGSELTPTIRALMTEQLEELDQLNQRINQLTRRLEQQARAIVPCRELQSLEGVGPINATQLYCALGDGSAFTNGRQASAYARLTPRQHSTGGKTTLIGIGKGGNGQLRAGLIRGAHAVIKALGDKQDAKSCWLRELVARAGANKAAVALANKTVRTAWAMLRTGEVYNPDHEHHLAAAV